VVQVKGPQNGCGVCVCVCDVAKLGVGDLQSTGDEEVTEFTCDASPVHAY